MYHSLFSDHSWQRSPARHCRLHLLTAMVTGVLFLVVSTIAADPAHGEETSGDTEAGKVDAGAAPLDVSWELDAERSTVAVDDIHDALNSSTPDVASCARHWLAENPSVTASADAPLSLTMLLEVESGSLVRHAVLAERDLSGLAKCIELIAPAWRLREIPDGRLEVTVTIQQNEEEPNLSAAGHEMAHQGESGTTPRENATEPPPLPESGSEVDLIRLQVSGARGSMSTDGSRTANGSIVSESDFLVLEGVLGGCFQALADHRIRGARTLSPRVTLRVESGQLVEVIALDPDVTAVPMPDGSADPLSRDFEACLREHLPSAELEISGTFTTAWKVPAVHVYLEELRQRDGFAAMPDVHREAHLVKERRIVAEGILRVVAGDVAECAGREQVEVRLKTEQSGHATLSAEEKLPREARKCLRELGDQLQVPPAGRGLNRRFVVEGSSGAVDVAEF